MPRVVKQGPDQLLIEGTFSRLLGSDKLGPEVLALTIDHLAHDHATGRMACKHKHVPRIFVALLDALRMTAYALPGKVANVVRTAPCKAHFSACFSAQGELPGRYEGQPTHCLARWPTWCGLLPARLTFLLRVAECWASSSRRERCTRLQSSSCLTSRNVRPRSWPSTVPTQRLTSRCTARMLASRQAPSLPVCDSAPAGNAARQRRSLSRR